MFYLLTNIITNMSEVYEERCDIEMTYNSLGITIPSNRLLKKIDTYYNHPLTCSVSKFSKGDIVVNLDGDFYKVLYYIYHPFNKDFLVGLEDVFTGLTRFGDDRQYDLWTKETDFLPKKEDVKQNKETECGFKNPECEIVKSFTGCGTSKGDEFWYCRTHKKEVFEDKVDTQTKPLYYNGFWS